MAHLNARSMDLLAKGLASGVQFTTEDRTQCEGCVLGKQFELPFPKAKARRATELLGIVHGDLNGPMRNPAWDGSRYIFLLVDDYSRKIFIF